VNVTVTYNPSGVPEPEVRALAARWVWSFAWDEQWTRLPAFPIPSVDGLELQVVRMYQVADNFMLWTNLVEPGG
jgi:hypothetical protein